MSRLRNALEVLESRQANVTRPLPRTPVPARPLAVEFETETTSTALLDLPPLEVTHPPARPAFDLPPARRLNAFEVCSLPTVLRPHENYLQMARRISEQGAANYCNVLLFVSADFNADASFSMVHIAQAYALQTAGDILLVDGDLRRGRLSQTVWPTGAGLIEAMLGTASWPDIIHPTTTPQIDFVPRGNSPIPTLERSQFGWGALRPKYRAVLIGVGAVQEPEIAWLATRCDAVYLLVSRAKTRRPAATDAVNSLRACGASVLGCIVTDD
jgi:Mrp family chromosome partitioning ATPase